MKVAIKTNYYGYPIEFSFEAPNLKELETLLNDAFDTVLKTRKAIEKLSNQIKQESGKIC